MSENKTKVSICGVHSFLITVGGWRDKAIKNCAKYSIPTNKWTVLPSLINARFDTGSCILSSKQVFTICGIAGFGQYVRSIETLNLDLDLKWTQIPFRHKISETYNLAPISYKGRIIVFGGTRQSTQKVCIINEEGQLVQDLSRVAVMGGYIVKGSILVERGKVYGVGCRKQKNEWIHKGEWFNGTRWWPI